MIPIDTYCNHLIVFVPGSGFKPYMVDIPTLSDRDLVSSKFTATLMQFLWQLLLIFLALDDFFVADDS